MQPTLTCCPRPTMALNASVRVCACACVCVCVCVPSTRSVFKHGTLPLAAHLPQHTPAPVSPKCRQRLKWRRFAASSCSLSLLLLSAAAAAASAAAPSLSSSSSALLAPSILIFKVVWSTATTCKRQERAQRRCSPRTTFWLQVNCECLVLVVVVVVVVRDLLWMGCTCEQVCVSLCLVVSCGLAASWWRWHLLNAETHKCSCCLRSKWQTA